MSLALGHHKKVISTSQKPDIFGTLMCERHFGQISLKSDKFRYPITAVINNVQPSAKESGTFKWTLIKDKSLKLF